MAQRLISPNKMHKAACDTMLNGKQPVTEMDWILIVNFYARNTAVESQPAGTVFLAVLMDCPLSKEAVTYIAMKQASANMAEQPE